MRAVVCRSYGPPEDLVVDDVADPIPGPGQLVVRVHAAAVNFPDVLLIAGKYQVKIPVPFTPGSELAGEVVAAGPYDKLIRNKDSLTAQYLSGQKEIKVPAQRRRGKTVQTKAKLAAASMRWSVLDIVILHGF